MRTIIDIPDSQLKAIDAYRKSRNLSRAAAIREALSAFLPVESGGIQDFRKNPAFGSSRSHRAEDSVVFVRQLRSEWE